jgi:PAS domain S-box-containing protein
VPIDRLFRSDMNFALGFPRPPLLLLWLIGIVILALSTAVCFALGLTTSSVGFIYLAVIVVLSLMDSLISSLIFSVIAVGLLDYFFIEPIFTFQITFDADISTLIAFVTASFGITSLVRRVRTLGESQHEQARLLDLTHDAIFVRGLDHVISFWNRGAENCYGWKREEAIGKVSHDLLKSVFPVPLDRIMGTLLDTGRWDGEVSRTRRDGSEIIVASRWSLEKDQEGAPVGLLEINTDITERKRAQEMLERIRAAYLAEAQTLSHTGSFAWRIESGDIVWSEESAHIYGCDVSVEPTIDLLIARVHPDDLAMVRAMYDRAIGEGQNFDFEHRLSMPGGATKNVHVVAHVMSENGHGRQFVGAVMDVTETKHAQELLQQAQANLAHVARVTMLGQLTASIGHEVNQPLAAIVTNGEAAIRYLRREPPELGEVREALTSMIAEGKRASEIVKRIRSLIQKATPQNEPLDINTVLAEGAALVQREIANHKVLLQLHLVPGLPEVMGDRVQLQQVIINLMMNAIQAMAGVEGRVRGLLVRSAQDATGSVVVAVQDSGEGLDPATADHVFDAFYSTKTDGMGMGLSICRTIMDAHDGRIWASANEGPGATFRFSLPAMDEASGGSR